MRRCDGKRSDSKRRNHGARESSAKHMFPPFCRCRLLSGFLRVLENVYVSPWPALTANYISGGPSQCKANAHRDQRDGVIGDARNATTGPDSQWAALMMGTTEFAQGGYRYIPAVFQYSGGVAALRGFEIRRVRFRSPIPLSEGFDTIERIIGETGRRWFVRACFGSTWTMELLRRDSHLQPMVKRSPRPRKPTAVESRKTPPALLALEAASVDLLGAL